MSFHSKGDYSSPEEALEKVWGYSHFRPLQKEIIEAVLNKHDALVLMATGSGKSLCFQLPTLLLSGLTVVVSPLIALMKDQVDSLTKLGLRAADINSRLGRQEREHRYKLLRQNELDIVFVTPERFQNDIFLEALSKNQINLLAVDEAHCISQWGHDFRPDYSRLGQIKELLGNPPTLALTATATPKTQNDIMKQLRFATPLVFDTGIERKNLSFEVIDLYGEEQKIQAFFAIWHELKSKYSDQRGCQIIYFSLVDSLNKFAEQLNKLGVDFLTYHGQMNKSDRSRSQDIFLKAQNTLLLATPAFGLGVNKPNINMVVHAEIPSSVESYYQEAGRAGRDDSEAICLLLFDQDDVQIQLDFLKWANPEPEFMRSVYQLLKYSGHEFVAGGTDALRRKLLFYHSRDFRLETTLNLFERWGVIEDAVDSRKWSVLKEFPEILNNEKVRAEQLKNGQMKLYQMIEYAKIETCRVQFIRKYFGFEESNPCGKCDQCRAAEAKI